MIRILLASVTAVLFVNVNAFLEHAPQGLNLAEDFLTIAYSRNLSCGACVRSGNTYCMDNKDSQSVGRGSKDICCDSADCVLQAQTNYTNLDCATTNTNFSVAPFFYQDRYAMLQKFCVRRQDNMACCGRNG